MRGSPEPLDIPALRSVTKYDGCGEDEPLIECVRSLPPPLSSAPLTLLPRPCASHSAFWQIVGRFDLNRQRKLLAFVTGSDRIPAQGLVNLDFRIQLTRAPPTHLPCESPSRPRSTCPLGLQQRRRLTLPPLARLPLPASHTCFNTISLPRYPSGAVLESKLVDAILESSGFGLK